MADTKQINGHVIGSGGDVDRSELFDLTKEFDEGGQTRAEVDRREQEQEKNK